MRHIRLVALQLASERQETTFFSMDLRALERRRSPRQLVRRRAQLSTPCYPVRFFPNIRVRLLEIFERMMYANPILTELMKYCTHQDGFPPLPLRVSGFSCPASCACPLTMAGESERVLHQLFDDAKKTKPSIIFLDELDALVRHTGDAFDRPSNRPRNRTREGCG